MLIGQQFLIDFVNKVDIKSLPHSILLIGENGCGKHLLVEMIGSKVGLPTIDLTGNVSAESLFECCTQIQPYIYTVNLNKLSDREQNILLKTVEEPYSNTYFIFTATSSNVVLPTLYNRCQHLCFAKYSTEDLLPFVPKSVDKNLALDIATTPGQLLQLEGVDLSAVQAFVNKILDKIELASPANTLKLTNSIAFNEEKSKFDVDLFNKMLQIEILHRIKSVNAPKYNKAFTIVSEYINRCDSKNANKKHLFENMILQLRAIMKDNYAITRS